MHFIGPATSAHHSIDIITLHSITSHLHRRVSYRDRDFVQRLGKTCSRHAARRWTIHPIQQRGHGTRVLARYSTSSLFNKGQGVAIQIAFHRPPFFVTGVCRRVTEIDLVRDHLQRGLHATIHRISRRSTSTDHHSRLIAFTRKGGFTFTTSWYRHLDVGSTAFF